MPYDSPEKYKAWVSRNRSRSNAIKRAWVLRNRDLDRALKLAYQRNSDNKAKLMEKVRRYQARKANALPKWAGREAMEAFYEEAIRLSRETGIKHEVDHVVPITHQLVCGLNCEANLQVIPMRLNRSKNNRYWPDMP